MLQVFKTLFGGLFSFFGILFGGLWDLVTGGSKLSTSTDSAPATSIPPTPAVVDPSPVVQPSTPVVSVVTPVQAQPTPPAPLSTLPLRTPVTVPVDSLTPFDPTTIMAPRPTRRPGKVLTSFKSMARDLSMRRLGSS